MNLVIFTGLQASGKSTYYKRNYVDTHVRVNLDMLKASRSKERKLMDGCIDAKIPCVIDNTNLTVEHRKVYIERYSQAGYQIESCFFDSSLEECLERNSTRDDKPPIANVALYTASKKLQIPEHCEGFTRVIAVSIVNGQYKDRIIKTVL